MATLGVLLIPLSAVLIHRVGEKSSVAEKSQRGNMRKKIVASVGETLKKQKIVHREIQVSNISENKAELRFDCLVETDRPLGTETAKAIASQLKTAMKKKKVIAKVVTRLSVEAEE